MRKLLHHPGVIAAVIVAAATLVAGLGAAVITTYHPFSNNTQPRSSNLPSLSSAPAPFNLTPEQNELDSEKTVIEGIQNLAFIYDTSAQSQERQAIIKILAQFISDHSPIPPNPTEYCAQYSPPAYPSYLLLALGIIGDRSHDDLSQPVNLSNISLAYVQLGNLHFENVNFDNDLLCRVIITGDNFEGASFSEADLQNSIITDDDFEGASFSRTDVQNAAIAGSEGLDAP